MTPAKQQLTDQQANAIRAILSNPTARIDNLYQVINKDGKSQRFKLNWAQRELHQSAHTRNNILKVRQLGISTYMALLMLDRCLFTPNYKAGIIDKTLKDASAKLDKIRFAFENLDAIPEEASDADSDTAAIGRMIKDYHSGIRFKAGEVIFPNGSSITIGTSLRGGTLQLLHVSELGSISVHDPMRAAEIITGALNTVGKNCNIYLESTHEGGKYGVNYEQICNAMDNIGKPLSPLHFKFYFFPWWRHPEYTLSNSNARPTDEQERYFSTLESENHITLSTEQKAWYIAMAQTQKSRMRQEYPSTPEEALNPITDGTIYAMQIGSLRERGHLKAEYEPDPHRPIYTSWDLGIGDYMSIWWIQPDGCGRWRILDNYTANNQPISHYISIMREHDARWGHCAACVLPHDASRRDINFNTYETAVSSAGYSTIRVPRTQNLWVSIDNTRELLACSIIHARCSEPSTCNGIAYIAGTDALSNYRLAPPGAYGNLPQQPLHDICSHASDALRTFADAVKTGLIAPSAGFLQNGSKRCRRSTYVENMLS